MYKKLLTVSAALISAFTVTGCVGDKEWQGATVIENQNGNASRPQVAFDKEGNAFAIWEQEGNNKNRSIYVNRFISGSGWGSAVLLENKNEDAMCPKIAIDENGNAIAVWRQKESNAYSIYAKRYTAGSGWGSAVLLENKNSDANCPQIAMDNEGNAIAVWSQKDNNVYSIYANRYSAGSGWGNAVAIEKYEKSADSPQIAMDSEGNAIAIWRQKTKVCCAYAYIMHANRYTAGKGWGEPVAIQSGDKHALSADIAFDKDGNAIVLWSQKRYTTWIGSTIYANRYVPGSGWEGDGEIATFYREAEAYEPKIVFDNEGNAIAVWSQRNTGANRTLKIYASRYIAGSGWEKKATLVTYKKNKDAQSLDLAIDSDGNAIVVWEEQDIKDDWGQWSIYAKKYDAQSSSWDSNATLLETGSGTARNPKVAMDKDGNAIAVWKQVDSSGYFSIYANRYEDSNNPYYNY